MLVTEFAGELHPANTQELLKELQLLFKLDDEIKDFIGAHPVGLTYNNMGLLLTEDYLACEKTDGIRLMMLAFQGVLYFYDRKNKFYATDLILRPDPASKTAQVFLFDGEMYREGDQHIFAMFDCLVYNSELKTELNLNKRLWCCFEFEKVFRKGLIMRKNGSQYTRFSIIGKPMFKSYAFPDILDSIPHLKHENDGLIFTPVHLPYLLQSRSAILKWKPPHLNTVDFTIRKSSTPTIYTLQCTVSEEQRQSIERRCVTGATVTFDYYFSEDEPEDIDEKVGEFSYDFSKEVVDMDDLTTKIGGWHLHRIRSDKNTSNNIKTVWETMSSIYESVRDEDLRTFQEAIRKNYKEREQKAAEGGTRGH